MRVFLSIILLTIISFQVLPVKKLSKSFLKGVATEKAHDMESSAPEDDGGNQFNNFESFFRTDHFYALSDTQYMDDPAILRVLYSETFHRQFVPDKDTPPPNFS